ncbi:hypothetical protein BC827DRAFT_260419 [Russula dissimulans]|nr:hypothetical protein BC827DRAFT_260419 [Russula dissimulans]
MIQGAAQTSQSSVASSSAHHGGPHPDNEITRNTPDDKGPASPQLNEKTVGQRLIPTINAAEEEHLNATKRETWTRWAQNIAISLEVLIGAVTATLGAALHGKHTDLAISILGIGSAVVGSYLARTKGSNEPQASHLRARLLEYFMRDINAFVLDHGLEPGDKWDEEINGFRIGLENIVGNQSAHFMIHPEAASYRAQERRVRGVDPIALSSGDGKDVVSPTIAAIAPNIV